MKQCFFAECADLMASSEDPDLGLHYVSKILGLLLYF